MGAWIVFFWGGFRYERYASYAYVLYVVGISDIRMGMESFGRTVYAVTTGEYSYYRVRVLCESLDDAIALEKKLRGDERKSEYAFGWEEMRLLPPGWKARKMRLWEASTGGVLDAEPSREWGEPLVWSHGEVWNFDYPEVAQGNVTYEVIVVTNDRKGVRRVDIKGPTKAKVVAAAKRLRERAAAGDAFDDLMNMDGQVMLRA